MTTNLSSKLQVIATIGVIAYCSAFAVSQPAFAAPDANDNQLSTVITSDGQVIVPKDVYSTITSRQNPPAKMVRPVVKNVKPIIRPPAASLIPPASKKDPYHRPLAVIGTDDRSKVDDTTVIPYKWIAQITFKQKGECAAGCGCTGWFIGGNTVMTAGHCVWGNGEWSTDVTVVPARNGDSVPYGTFSAKRLYSVLGWTQNNDSNYDYGAIKLSESASVGSMGFRWTSASLQDVEETVSGYPCDKGGDTQWYHADKIWESGTYVLKYKNDTAGCQSGAPVYQVYNGVCCYGIAVHVRGGTEYNEGTRIRQAVFNNMLFWRDQP